MSEMLSQEEINSLLNNNPGTGDDAGTQDVDTAPEAAVDDSSMDEFLHGKIRDISEVLTDVERDALGEIGNISMGAAATALSNMLSRRVDITTPIVTLTNTAELSQRYERPCVSVNVPYVEGLYGDNVLVIKMEDVKAITSLLIGSDDFAGSDVEISEIHLSAISEVMNQMMGSSATSLSQLTNMKINIAPPAAEVMDFSEKFASNTNIIEDAREELIAITFKMDVEELFVTDIVLLMRPNFGKSMVSSFFASNGVVFDAEAKEEQMIEEATAAAAAETASAASASAAAPTQAPPTQAPPAGDPYAQPGAYPPPPPYPYPPYPYPPYGAPQPMAPQPTVNVQSVQFENFAPTPVQVPTENIGMLMDVPLQVNVELGKSKKTLKDILELNIGSIITLDKTSGEMVDVIINGKMVAKGEVVVVDDNFAVRITEIFNNINKVL